MCLTRGFCLWSDQPNVHQTFIRLQNILWHCPAVIYIRVNQTAQWYKAAVAQIQQHVFQENHVFPKPCCMHSAYHTPKNISLCEEVGEVTYLQTRAFFAEGNYVWNGVFYFILFYTQCICWKGRSLQRCAPMLFKKSCRCLNMFGLNGLTQRYEYQNRFYTPIGCLCSCVGICALRFACKKC